MWFDDPLLDDLDDELDLEEEVDDWDTEFEEDKKKEEEQQINCI